MEPTHPSSFGPHDDPERGEHLGDRSRGPQPFGFRPDPLLAELRSGQYDSMRLEAVVSLFCADMAESQPTSPGSPKIVSDVSPEIEQLEGAVRSFFWPASGEHKTVVRERFETVFKVVQAAIAEHLGGDTSRQDHARVVLHSIVFSEAVSCLTSNNLSAAMRDLEWSVDTSILRPFEHHIDQELGRIAALNRVGQLPPELLQKAASARIDQRAHEAESALKAIDARLDELSQLFFPLTQQAIDELGSWVPGQSSEYLAELHDYVRSRFALPFSQALSDVRHDSRLAISKGVGKLEAALPSGASGTEI